MTLKTFVREAQQFLETRSACTVGRSHVYELLAAAFGCRSWAAFMSDSMLADGGAGKQPNGNLPDVIGRAIQLGYGGGIATTIADAMTTFAAVRGVRAIRWSDLEELLLPAPHRQVEDFDGDGEDIDVDDEDREAASVPVHEPACDQLLSSPLFRDSLERARGSIDAPRHRILAALYRCARPRPHLYEESLKGRHLTTVERAWVDDYLRLAPRFEMYELHLRAAAQGGIRSAALEYAEVFDDGDFLELADRLPGEVDASRMARMATSAEARRSWLRVAADEGSPSALQELAESGDEGAEKRLAESGDRGWLRLMAERALDKGDMPKAWAWQYLALEYGIDLAQSTMAARHDGGQLDGEFYDSDFGGPLYVDGNEALEFPTMSPEQHLASKDWARTRFTGIQPEPPGGEESW